jgi:Flp pilus assembly protein TadD
VVRTARLQRHVTRQSLPDSSTLAKGSTGQLHRIVFAVGAVAFVSACLLGIAQSLRSDQRLPAANVLVDGPAEHIETLLRNKQYDEAMRQLAQYETMSNDRLPHERVAVVLSQLDPEARRGAAEALRAHPGYTQGHYQLGLAFLEADEYASAQSEFEEVLRAQPRHAEAHNALGMALAYQGDGEGAAAQFWQALRLKPDFQEPQVNLGKIEPLLNRPAPQASSTETTTPRPASSVAGN